jgi:hypothetical protein
MALDAHGSKVEHGLIVSTATHDPNAHASRHSPLRGVALGLAVVVGLSFFTCAGFVVYGGAVGPEIHVYPGNLVPKRFITIMRDVGALEDGEQIDFFYSDSFSDIRDGFYFVSDRRVVIYAQDAGDTPLTSVAFDQIAQAHLLRDTSFIDDSEIVLELHDGRVLPFPASSERDRDVLFHQAIERRIDE